MIITVGALFRDNKGDVWTAREMALSQVDNYCGKGMAVWSMNRYVGSILSQQYFYENGTTVNESTRRIVKEIKP